MTATPKRTLLGQGKYLRLVREDRWEYIERCLASGVVVLVPVDDAGNLILVEQYRWPVRTHCVELPAGLVGDEAGQEGEGLETAARRELLEETGYEARNLRLVATAAPTAGACSEIVSIYLATGLVRRHAGGGDATENLKVHAVPLATVPAWLAAQQAAGKVIDLKVYAGLYFAAGRAAAQ